MKQRIPLFLLYFFQIQSNTVAYRLCSAVVVLPRAHLRFLLAEKTEILNFA